MRLFACSCCFLALLGFVAPSKAAPKVTSRTTTFPISGPTGDALLKELERKGPKHGFTSRAIAQTRYTMNSEAEWNHARGVCAVTRPMVRLDITYIYPEVKGETSDPLRGRWQRFMAGIRKHEEQHGRLAREMAAEADKTIAGLKVQDGKACGKLRAEMKRVVAAIVGRYEARQRQFDVVEHKSGGNVEGLVKRLVTK